MEKNTTTTTKQPVEGSSKEEEQQQQPSPKQQRRGRPKNTTSTSRSRDKSNDVLTLKGAAAQQTTHLGNLNYYALCEERFDRWAALDCDDPGRKQICKEIVKIVSERGGVFRKASGGAMDIKAAIDKTNSRFKQIAKPKVRFHTGMYGENDVVFAKGARNHMYPGNAKWRTLLDGYALSYHRDMDKIEEKRKTSFFTPPRPSYQVDIAEEVISIVEKRGGKFLDEKLKPLAHNVIVEKTHNRFKDMKKEIKSGKLVLTATKKEEPTDDAGEDNIQANKSATSVIIKKSRELVTPGFTSVKTTVSSKKELQKMMAKSQRRRKKFYGNQFKAADEVILDDVSIPPVASSDEYEMEDDDDAADMDERAKEDEVFKNSSRYERRKRRASGEPAPPRPSTEEKQTKKTIKKERKHTKQIKKEKRRRAPSPEPYTLSEYEQMRLAKVQRNHKRLKDLGLG